MICPRRVYTWLLPSCHRAWPVSVSDLSRISSNCRFLDLKIPPTMDLNKGAQPAFQTMNQEDLKRFEYDVSVPAKYRGTTADQRDMAMLGKKQVLRVSIWGTLCAVSLLWLIKSLQRNFKFVTMLGFASTVMASWEVLLVLFKLTLLTGGFANLFWGFLVNVCGMLFVYASIAELASM